MQNPIQEFDFLPDAAHVRLPVVMALYGCSAPTVRHAVKAGSIPKPLKHLDRAISWNVGELRRALAKAVTP